MTKEMINQNVIMGIDVDPQWKDNVATGQKAIQYGYNNVRLGPKDEENTEITP